MRRCSQSIESKWGTRPNRLEVSFLAAGGKATVLEGQWEHPGTVIVEFPSRESAERWYESTAYQKIIGLRLKGTSGSLVILDGT